MAGPQRKKTVRRTKAATAARESWSTAAALAELRARASREVRDGMARYAIPSDKALGVSVGKIRELAKQIGRDHQLALDLWKSEVYEARMLAAFVDDPMEVTTAQMERWSKDFDNWAICDTVCFHLFDKSPLAFKKVDQWAKRRDEFGRRASFALLASLALHDRKAPDEEFLSRLPLVESAADDSRNFVKKAVSWALRGIGGRRAGLRAPALDLAKRLAASADATERWVGKDALKELSKADRKPRQKG